MLDIALHVHGRLGRALEWRHKDLQLTGIGAIIEDAYVLRAAQVCFVGSVLASVIRSFSASAIRALSYSLH